MPEIHKVLVVSTAHFRREEFLTLEEGGKSDEYGSLFYVDEDSLAFENASPETQKLFREAIDLECSYIMADCDGEILEGFETFEDTWNPSAPKPVFSSEGQIGLAETLGEKPCSE